MICWPGRDVSFLSGTSKNSFDMNMTDQHSSVSNAPAASGKAMDVLVGGMPRSGTTVTAKFLSLDPDIFCYAGETHVIPLMMSLTGRIPCLSEQTERIVQFMSHHLKVTLLDMPRYSVAHGAHPANLIFDEPDVEFLTHEIRDLLSRQQTGVLLYQSLQAILRRVISNRVPRSIIGEKTPSNIFSMALHATGDSARHVVVVREPFGVIRSMSKRVSGKDPYSGCFDGEIEHQIGLYVEYGNAAVRCRAGNRCLLVHHEDLACDPFAVVSGLFALFDRHPDERILRFVEQGRDKEVADRAPMYYKRLTLSSDISHLSSVDIWKIFHLTGAVRKSLGYSTDEMTRYGFPATADWPSGVPVPDRLVPLSGFHEQTGQGLFMKDIAVIAAYFSRLRTYRLVFELESNFPEACGAHATLGVFIGGQRIHESQVASGNRIAKFEFSVSANALHPIDSSGAYSLIELRSSHVYAPLAHLRGGFDHRERSFKIKSMKIVPDHV